MSYMFSDCSSLISLPNNISKWDISKVETMFKMFLNCLSLSKLPDISKWKLKGQIFGNKLHSLCINLLSFPSKLDKTYNI